MNARNVLQSVTQSNMTNDKFLLLFRGHITKIATV